MLCHRIDPQILVRNPCRDLAWYDNAANSQALGHVRAYSFASECTRPETAEEFQSLIREAHCRIYASSEPHIAGRFRGEGEEVWVDENRHQYAGVSADQIVPRLCLLSERTFVPLTRSESREEFNHRGADLLQRFFEIHPFVDGNGRVARLLLNLAARLTERWSFDRQDGRTSGKDRRRYVCALRAAHRGRGLTSAEHERGERPGALVPLARWLDQHLADLPDDLVEAEPPDG